MCLLNQPTSQYWWDPIFYWHGGLIWSEKQSTDAKITYICIFWHCASVRWSSDLTAMKVEKSVELCRTEWTSFATNVQNLLQRKSILWFITIQTVPHQTCQDTWQRKGLWGTQVLPWMWKIISCKRNLTKHLKIHQSLFSFNMSGYFVVVGDLLDVPLGPFPLDTLINFWLPLDPLPDSSLSNYSLPIDFVYNNLEQAFWFYSKAWINDKERFILLFMNWQITRSPWL